MNRRGKTVQQFVALSIVLSSLVANCVTAARTNSRTSTQNQNQSVTAEELVQQARDVYRKKDFGLSAKLFESAIAKGARERGVFYDAACSFALAGNKDRAFHFLREAIRAGWRNVNHLKTDTDLNSLHDDSRWVKTVAACEQQQAKFIKDHSDPSRVRFITEDVNRFWAAYDKAMLALPAERADIFQRDYIAPGTVGLKDFARSGRLNSKTLAKVIDARPNFFKAIRPMTLSINAQRAEAIRAFRKFKQLYPDAIFPDVYFIVGQLSSGGTASDQGLLMGVEMFSESAAAPTDELSEWEKRAIMAVSEIPPLVAHEFVHFQQKFPNQNSLLCQCLKEGSADFLGELSAGRVITRMRETQTWANAREPELWQEFQKEMDGKDVSHWLYGSSGGNGRPVDLGYWIGYKISQAYYQNSSDKRQAVHDTVKVPDCQAFLKASRYVERFASGGSLTDWFR